MYDYIYTSEFVTGVYVANRTRSRSVAAVGVNGEYKEMQLWLRCVYIYMVTGECIINIRV